MNRFAVTFTFHEADFTIAAINALVIVADDFNNLSEKITKELDEYDRLAVSANREIRVTIDYLA